jgi:hypothetical protein
LCLSDDNVTSDRSFRAVELFSHRLVFAGNPKM